MKRSVLSFLRKQSFQPGFSGILINPFYFIRRQLFKNISLYSPRLKGQLMDFGCGRKPYKNLFTNVSEYIGVDIEQKTGHDHTNSLVDVYYDGKKIPFENNHFDSVFCGEVLEHIFNIEEILPELHRVLKSGGQILITVPFCWNEHEVPYDFGRYTSFGMKHLLEKNGFKILESTKSGHFSQVTFQLFALYFYEIFKSWIKPKALHYLLTMLLVIPINIAGLIICTILPRNKSLYFNNILLAQKI